MGIDFKKKSVRVSLISGGALLIVVLLLFGSAFAVTANFDKSNKILDGVMFSDKELSGMNKEEVKTLIAENKDLPVYKKIKVTYEGKSFDITLDGAGVTYDKEKIAEKAYEQGRKGFVLSRAFKILFGKDNKKVINPIYNTNIKIFEETVSQLSELAGINFKNFSVSLSDDSAEVKISENPTKIDYNGTMQAIMAVIDSDKNEVPLRVSEGEAVSADEIYNAIYVEPRDAEIKKENGKTSIIEEQTGILLEKEDIENALLNNEKTFKIKIKKKYPAKTVKSLESGIFSDCLGVYTSTYNNGIVGRTRNVTLAASKINGKILNSGDVFSYNHTVGPRTSAAGFSTATIYTNDGLSEELGGGICQVSSTLYNAVLYADLKIVERRNHMYTVSYVKNGLDATVAYGSIDFRFKNSNSNPIKIVATTGGGVLTVKIMGTKENDNKVTLSTNTLESYDYPVKYVENPSLAQGTEVVKQKGGKGYKITATKTVTDSSGNVIRTESLGTSVYKPLAKIIERNGGALPATEPITEETMPAEQTPQEQEPVNEIPENPENEEKPSLDEPAAEDINIKPIELD